jgi:hypothetical protein
MPNLNLTLFAVSWSIVRLVYNRLSVKNCLNPAIEANAALILITMPWNLALEYLPTEGE